VLLHGIVSIVESLAEGILRNLSLLIDRAAAESSRPDAANGWAVPSEREEYLRKAETMRIDARLGIRRIGEY
jgi:hypothetical protein